MLMAVGKGNLEQVREALIGITGVAPAAQPEPIEQWIMLIARSNHELEAVDSLRRHHHRAYWPSYIKWVASRRQQAGRSLRRMVRISIVPYILTPAVDAIDDLKENIIGVLDVVRTFSGKPLFLSGIDIRIIRKIDAGLNTPKPDRLAHNFKIGEKVRFCDDVSHHWAPGTIIKLASDKRISVEVDMMGRKVPITVFPFQIERT